jgi:hypothetical protein
MHESAALNGHFVSAGSPLITAEMTQMQRMARLMPPLCQMRLPLLSLQFKNSTQGRKDVKTQRNTGSF